MNSAINIAMIIAMNFSKKFAKPFAKHVSMYGKCRTVQRSRLRFHSGGSSGPDRYLEMIAQVISGTA